jgi:hypothetical protein
METFWAIFLSLILILVGFFGGYIAGFGALLKKRKIGRLRLDRSDPDGPFIFLEGDVPIEHIIRYKYIVLEVVTEDFIPQK